MWDVMLGKGFKASKCKTLLKLAMARIKLLRNKRDIQVKQLRKDIAQLLSTGQEPSARIRVEHIIREQNILAAYDILELFCELVAVRLPIIESQKNCPLDLKEAISSLIFASPRCSDLPELLQIRALFAAKYGKEFAAAAAELRPDCGVNRRIIEKLSVRAPPGDVKLKLMKEIAVEHDVDWDATDSEAELLKAPEDLLDGPNHFIAAYEMPPPPLSKSELPSVPSELPSKELPAPLASEMSPDLTAPQTGMSSPDIVNEDNGKRFVPFGNIPPPMKYEAPSPPVPLSQGMQNNEGANEKVPHLGKYDTPSNARPDEDVYAQARREGNMDYIDVAAAAKAAAESADRAVAAARAAAELARKHRDHGARESNNRIGRQESSAAVQVESSDTDLDSDTEDGGNTPVKAAAPHSRHGGETKPVPAIDSDSDVEEYDVPRGRGAGGTKGRFQAEAYKQSLSREAYDEPKLPSKAMKLDFDSADAPGKPLFDDFDDVAKEVEDDSIFTRHGKQERENRSYGGDSTSGKKGGGLKWHSKAEPERYDIFDINREEPANPYSAFNSTDYYFGKNSIDGGQEDESSRSGKKFPSFDQPYAGQSARTKPGAKSREGSPLFDEEGSVGRSQREPSRLGSFPRTSGYNDQDDAAQFSSPPKSALNDFSVTAKTEGFGSWGKVGPPSSDSPTTTSVFNSGTSPNYDELTARFEALKTKR